MRLYKPQKPDGTRSRFWWADFTVNGVRYRKSTQATLKRSAEAIASKLQSAAAEGRYLEVAAPKDAAPTFEDHSREYVLGPGRDKKSRADDLSILRRSLNPAFGPKRLSEITREDVESWKADRKRAVSPATLLNEFALLRHLLNLAERDRIIEHNPARAVRITRPDNGRDRVVQPDELAAICKAAKDGLAYWRPLATLLYETGMRSGEARLLRWKDLTLGPNSGFARLEDTKNGSRARVPLNAAAVEALRAWGDTQPQEPAHYVFPGRSGPVSPIAKTSLPHAWKRLTAAAEVEGVRVHDLRHTFATRLQAAGVDPLTSAALLRHRSMTMLKRYTHPTDAHLLGRVQNLGRVPATATDSGASKSA